MKIIHHYSLLFNRVLNPAAARPASRRPVGGEGAAAVEVALEHAAAASKPTFFVLYSWLAFGKLRGSFSAVSKPIFETIYSFESS